MRRYLMEINDFILSKHNDVEKFEYGVKLMPKRTLDKLTDSMIISKEKNVNKTDVYNICFKRRQGLRIVLNNFTLSEKSFKEYMDFLLGFNGKFIKTEKNIKSEFIVDNGGKITLSSLNKDYIKISSEKVENSSLDKVFFTLLRAELLVYIEVLNNIYSGKEIVSSLNYSMGYLINPLSKAEREQLYLDALYAFIDSALDHRNRQAFDMLSREVQRVLNY
jgi:hypothetical protein